MTALRGGANPRRRNIVVALPLLVFVVLAAVLYAGLRDGNPSRLPSALIGKPVPPTDLPPIPGLAVDGRPVPGVTNATLAGAVSLVNVWASWCVPCHAEIPFLNALAKDGHVRLVGINYKDAPDDARRFLHRYGNPFVAAGRDESGRTSIDWGVYGVPETFLIGRDGRIVYKLVGPITAQNLQSELLPRIEKALTR
ncbi:MAG: DsbE family thiol:disulfide interchange protein [Pseudolabrys sp.]|nr:DsbE family thiol:disulfide interchange protein [Pseudolabrys sp.]